MHESWISEILNFITDELIKLLQILLIFIHKSFDVQVYIKVLVSLRDDLAFLTSIDFLQSIYDFFVFGLKPIYRVLLLLFSILAGKIIF
jgi:hypothetical protein